MKNNFRKLLVLALICVGAIILFTSRDFYRKGKQDNKECEKIYLNTPLEKVLEQNINLEGGYHDVIDARLYDFDKLYYTYYTLLCLECLKNDDFSQEKWIPLKKNVKYIEDEILISQNEQMFDNVSNIYYYVKICDLLGVQIVKEKMELVINYIKSVQTAEGCYAFSILQKDKIESGKYREDGYSEVLLSTLMAVEVLDMLDAQEKNNIKLEKWVKDKVIEYREGELSVLSFPDILLLNKILSKLGIENLDSNAMLKRLYQMIGDSLLETYLKDKKVDVLLLGDWLDACIVLKKESEMSERFKVFQSYLKGLQSEDGWYGIDCNSGGNILPTYYIVKYFSITDMDFDEKKVLRALYSVQSEEGFFLPVTNRESTIKDTYYTYMISEFACDEYKKEVHKNVERYIKRIEWMDVCYTEDDYLYYLILREELSYPADNESFCLLEKKFLSEIENTSLNDSAEYMKIITILNIFNHQNMTISNQNITHLKEQINNIEIGKLDEVEQYWIMCLRLELLKLLKISSGEFEIERMQKTVIQTLKNELEDIDVEYRSYLLYWSIRCLNSWDIDIKSIISNEGIENVLSYCKMGQLYSLNGKDYPTLESTYYVYFVFQLLNRT